MLAGKRILAIVPARQGSKGIPDKNIQEIQGISLIGWAGRCLTTLSWLDGKIITTDSPRYAAEGIKFGLDAPFLRPAELSGDCATAVDTISHALLQAEKFYQHSFDIVLIVEPTCPLRNQEDILQTVQMLINEKVDSVFTVSEVPGKYKPAKLFQLDGNKAKFYESIGAKIANRQELGQFYCKNGACYALTRECLLTKQVIISECSLALPVDRVLVNIDEPLELEWARYLAEKLDQPDKLFGGKG